MPDFCSDCKHDAKPIERCSLCTATATIHMPPELGALALCRACADRVRAALLPPDEADRRALAAISDRPILPRCLCQECSGHG